MLVVEKNIKMPPLRRRRKYTELYGLEIGESVAVPRELICKVRGVLAYIQKVAKINLTCRTAEDGSARVWRIS